jgi:hypothetical protein
MLSKEQIDFIDKNLMTVNLTALDEVFAQAVLAISLQAEVDRLKGIISALESANDELRAIVKGGAK